MYASERKGRLVLFVLSLVLVALVVTPIWQPLLLAAVLAGTTAGWHDRLAHELGGHRSASAALFTAAIVVVILIPVGAASFFVVEQALALVGLIRHTLAAKGVLGLLEPLPDPVEHWLDGHFHLSSGAGSGGLLERLDFLSSRAQWIAGTAVGALTSFWHVLFSGVLMLIAVFFLLRDGHALTGWLRRSAVLPTEDFDELTRQLRRVSKAVIGGNVLAGAAQAAVATGGYLIASVPSPLFLGLLTFFASFVPSVGVALVGLPVAGLLLLLGHPWWALFLALWVLAVVGLVDNLLRPFLMRGGSRGQGALIFFSLIGGVLLVGAIGLVLGPLALTFFLVMKDRLRRDAPE
jgi:predicted PurR-regulated permease PerM